MLITAIVAMDRHGLIGDGATMPWHLPRDLKRFRSLTMGKPIIMGRRTFGSLPEPLAGRLNIVLTQNSQLAEEGFRVASSIEQALRIAEDQLAHTNGDEAMIIGGGIIYDATCPRWDRLLLTVVEGDFAGVTYFPVDRIKQIPWRLVGQESWGTDPKNRHAHRFVNLKRIPRETHPEPVFDLGGWLSESSHGSTAGI